MSYQHIAVEYREQIGILRLNRPDKLNAINAPVVEELQVALEEITAKSKVLVLSGAGRAFCSGAALDEGATNDERSQRDLGSILETHVNPLMIRLRNLPIPWVSAVHGAAAGAGASLALAADLVIAGESAFFLQAFARVGLVPDAGSTYLLARTIGRVRAMELTLLAERLPAATALEWGLINRVVPDASLESEALAVAGQLARGPGVALGLIRKAVWSAVEGPWTEALELERRFQAVAGQTRDFEEGVAAFNEKRPPAFVGG